MRRAVVALCALAAVVVGVLGACRAPAEGWQPLWHDRWTWHHRGWVWLRGVEAADLELRVAGSRARLRAEAFNPGDQEASLELDGPGEGGQRWRLAPLERRPLDLDLAAGGHRLRSTGSVVLGEPRLGRPLARPRLLVFVVVDTLRADHVRGSTMPGVLAAFDGGRRWARATSNCSWTLPSMASMFTARPVLDLATAEGDLIGIPEGVATWAAQLEAAGFAGGAVVANPTVHTLNGFAAGFSSYQVPDTGVAAPYPDASWVAVEGRRWLAAHRGEDAFLYLHLMDPHQPYRSHSDPAVETPDLEPLAKRRRAATPEEAAQLRRLYGEEVRHVDQVMAPFIEELPGDAVVVLTADHGEALGEHGAWGHGLNLYQEALHVPLMMRGPGVPAGEVDDPVQLLDVAPTVLGLMDVRQAPEMAGRSLLAGGSGQPLVSVTFGAGPLRWAWRAGDDKVVVRMAAQEGLGAASGVSFVEGDPLPSGAFHVDLGSDPEEAHPGPLPPRLVEEVGGAFAATAGRLVPGLQLLGWALPGQTRLAVEVAGEVKVVQAWSTGPMAVTRHGGRLEVLCQEGFPVCAVAADVSPAPAGVTPLADAGGWRRVAAGTPLAPGELPPPPAALAAGGWLWWNPERTRVMTGQEETIRRLRALGYIE